MEVMKWQLSNCLAFVGIVMVEKLSNHSGSSKTYVQSEKQDGKINIKKKYSLQYYSFAKEF